MSTMTINERLKEAGCQLDGHESDLYVKNTRVAREIIATHFEFADNVEQFRSQVDNEIWLCLPFCNDFWWEKRDGFRRQKPRMRAFSEIGLKPSNE